MENLSTSTDLDTTIQKATELFKQQLTCEEREKLPYGLDGNLKNEHSAPEDATSRIFFETGFPTYVAYHLAWSKCNGRNYKGQSNEKEVLQAFDKLTRENRKAVATEILNTNIHPHVLSLIEHFQSNRKRRRESAALSRMMF
jgi:hypothetical protein